MGMFGSGRGNLFSAINSNSRKGKSDYIVYDGFVMNKAGLINNGWLDEASLKSDQYYPIFIPGRHTPTYPNNTLIANTDVTNVKSELYVNAFYYELCFKDDVGTPEPGWHVRVTFDRTNDKMYSTPCFKIVDFKHHNGSGYDDYGGTENQNKVHEGAKVSFVEMFIGEFGKCIVGLKNNNEGTNSNHGCVSRNLYSIAYTESRCSTGAVGSQGELGLFQLMNHDQNTIKANLDAGMKVIRSNGILNQTILTYDKWNDSVISTPNSITVENSWIVDVQLVAYIGYLDIRKYTDSLSLYKTYEDNTEFQKAQGYGSDKDQYKAQLQVGYEDSNAGFTAVSNDVKRIITKPTTEAEYRIKNYLDKFNGQ